MIEMTCGAYGAKSGLIRPADGPFSLSVEEEQRLVNRGVARYVQEQVEPAPPVPPVPPVPPPGEPEGHEDEGSKEDKAKLPQTEPEKPAKAKKPGKTHTDESALPDLTPEGPVV